MGRQNQEILWNIPLKEGQNIYKTVRLHPLQGKILLGNHALPVKENSFINQASDNYRKKSDVMDNEIMAYCTHPYVQYTSQRNTSEQQHPYLSDYLQDFEQKVNTWEQEKTSQSQIHKYLILRYRPGRNWSVRFIYCINFSVVPIIQSLKINSPTIQIQLSVW